MAATLMDGKALAGSIRAEVSEDVRELGGLGLTTVLVGDDPASDLYIRLKHKAARRGRDPRRRHAAAGDDLAGRAARAGSPN